MTATPAPTAINDLQRNAYNAAFYKLGLGWHWDHITFDSLQPLGCEVERIRTYMEAHHAHLLKAYDPGFLASATEITRSRFIDSERDGVNTRSGHTDWAALHSRQIGV